MAVAGLGSPFGSAYRGIRTRAVKKTEAYDPKTQMENNKRPESMERIFAKSLADVSIAEWRDNFYIIRSISPVCLNILKK